MTSGSKGQDETRINWSELEDPDVKLGWKLCRTSISHHFFDGSMVVIPVPMLQEADEFDLMTCFTKPDVELDPQFLIQDFEIQGKFADLILTTNNEEGRTTHMDKMKEVVPETEEFEAKVEAYCFQNADFSKSVEIDFTNLSKEKVNLTEFDKGHVVFNMDKLMEKLDMGGYRRCLFVIHEVIFAEGLQVTVTVDGQSVHKRINGRKMPVAFNCTKIEICATGVLKVDNDDDDFPHF